ncbi:hypothetical protein K435DRAFT_960523 [Dendrothele bispora CBS 962.96]|uniref:DUF6533 domain-containing protein n=1 Tax=Dendrothele bispora (strain CBS 962.96) TaxID=1314807 RepID=A0A4V4HIG8_DENBC|nr:hypothetical protein K435DRAFT_960523 [Dendrothele bispora CBS 962.96]
MLASAGEVQIQVNWNDYVELASFGELSGHSSLLVYLTRHCHHTVILYYDYSLTFRDEVEYFWKRPNRSLVAALFYLSRYLPLFGNVPILVFRFWPDQNGTSCQAKEYYNQFFLAIVQLIISVLFVIRVYAIYEQNKKLLALLIFAVTAMVINGALQWVLSKGTIGVDVTNAKALGVNVNCLQSYTTSQGNHLVYMWIGIVTVDFLVFGLTLYKTIQLQRTCKGSDLWLVIMRDGALYFGIITFINTANILVFAIAKDFMKALLAGFANVIASVMITRLMLNLRAISQETQNFSLPTLSETMAMSFAMRPTSTMIQGWVSDV